jgi:hypothetical protein
VAASWLSLRTRRNRRVASGPGATSTAKRTRMCVDHIAVAVALDERGHNAQATTKERLVTRQNCNEHLRGEKRIPLSRKSKPVAHRLSVICLSTSSRPRCRCTCVKMISMNPRAHHRNANEPHKRSRQNSWSFAWHLRPHPSDERAGADWLETDEQVRMHPYDRQLVCNGPTGQPGRRTEVTRRQQRILGLSEAKNGVTRLACAWCAVLSCIRKS